MHPHPLVVRDALFVSLFLHNQETVVFLQKPKKHLMENKELKRLPVGIQTFEKLVEQECRRSHREYDIPFTRALS